MAGATVDSDEQSPFPALLEEEAQSVQASIKEAVMRWLRRGLLWVILVALATGLGYLASSSGLL